MRAVLVSLGGVLALAASARSCHAGRTVDEQILGRALSEFERGKEANEPATAQRHFHRSADAWEELRQRGVHNSELYLNQGNAEMLAGRLGHALMAYQRGLRLSPNNPALQAQRDYVRGRVAHTSAVGKPAQSAWPPWLPYPTLDYALAAAAFLYTLACIAGTRAIMRRCKRWLARGILLLALALAALGVAAWLAAKEAREEEQPLVIVAAAEGAPFYKGNGVSFPRHEALAALPCGLEARCLHERGDWLQIRLATGEVGWVKAQDVLVE